jgi:hypothetical protein
VPQSQEKTPEQTTELPNPDLNPLLNPTLGRHLGRWAQVYFTSPPEKREEAVEELLRELQGNPSVTQEEPTIAPDEPAALNTSPVETIRIVEAAAVPSSLQCAECGHSHTSPQRFCGMCGAPLEAEQTASAEKIPQSHTVRTFEPLVTHADMPSLSPVSESVKPLDDTYSDIRWLREKSLSGDAVSWWGRARYAPAIIAVLAIGILFYAQSRPQKAPGQSAAKTMQSTPESAKPSAPPPAPTAAETARVDRSVQPSPAASTEPALPDAGQSKPSVPPPSAAAAGDNAKPKAGNSVPSASPSEPAATLNPANGAAELAIAEDFLSGKTHPRNSEEAAKYLWRAVGKENPTAILLLSDMYLAGDGVPRSCDQARLLLSAAAKKGVSQAAERLRDLLRSGCPK